MELSFDLRSPDTLGVLESTRAVAQAAAHVKLHAEAVRRFARAQAHLPPPAPPQEALHCTWLPPRRRLNYLLALDALNFCFWDVEPRWRVPYREGRYDGYWALAAALHRAIREDALPLWDAHFLAELEPATLAHLLRGEGRPVPLLAERLSNLREAGRVLVERWQGQFAALIATAGGDTVALVRLIVAELPSFRDEASWQGRPVRFYKRAQICVADLARWLADEEADGVGERLLGLEHLTAFADYKLPQVLRHVGVLSYAPALAAAVDARQELPPGSVEEVEIRAATIWACEWIARAMTAERGAAAPGSAVPVAAAEVDYRLWCAGQDAAGMAPYHRTRTIFY